MPKTDLDKVIDEYLDLCAEANREKAQKSDAQLAREANASEVLLAAERGRAPAAAPAVPSVLDLTLEAGLFGEDGTPRAGASAARVKRARPAAGEGLEDVGIARGKTKAGSSVAPFHKLSRLHFPLGKTRYHISKGWAETGKGKSISHSLFQTSFRGLVRTIRE